MGGHNQAPNIAEQTVRVQEYPLQPLAYADPGMFPAGMEVVIFVPGNLEPVGKMVLRPGAVLMAVPPGPVAQHIVQQVRQQAGALAPGDVRAPGMPH